MQKEHQVETSTMETYHINFRKVHEDYTTKACQTAVDALGKEDSNIDKQWGDVPEYVMKDNVEKHAVEYAQSMRPKTFMSIENVHMAIRPYSIVWYKDNCGSIYQITFFDPHDVKFWHIKRVDMHELTQKHFPRKSQQKKIGELCVKMTKKYLTGTLDCGVCRTLNHTEQLGAHDAIQDIKVGKYVVVQERFWGTPTCVVWYKHTDDKVFHICFANQNLDPQFTGIDEVDLESIKHLNTLRKHSIE